MNRRICQAALAALLCCAIAACGSEEVGITRTTPSPTGTPTPTALPTPTQRTTFTVRGCVVHFSSCNPSVEFGSVALSPLDHEADVEFGSFSFRDIPPGDYTLTFSPSCNPAGCTRPVPITVVDHDVYVSILRYADDL